MSQFISEEELAKIAISKNLIKEYKDSENGRTVYLKDGTEFQIYIKNPHQFHIGIDIYVNNKTIGNRLVLRPGQSVWLERYLDSDEKFLFSTYEVENTTEMHYAIAKNGTVRLQFYKERESSRSYTYVEPIRVVTNGSSNYYNNCISSINSSDTLGASSNVTVTALNSSNSVLNISGCEKGITTTATYCSSNTNTNKTLTKVKGLFSELSVPQNIETGRVERGSKSDQKFKNVNIDFEYSPFHTEDINILPMSRKTMTANEIRRKYCSQCGKKVKPADKFCSNCGYKLN